MRLLNQQPDFDEKELEDAFRKTNLEGDEKIELREIIEYQLERVSTEGFLLIGIYWIGHILQPS